MSNGRPRQLPLSMPHEAALTRADFIVGEANRDATAFIDAWPDWPASVVLLIGPPGSGKSHLASAWSERSGAPVIDAIDLCDHDPTLLVGRGAVAVEDVDEPGISETALFHLLNAARARGASLLLTADSVPDDWGLALPDLISRLRAAQPAFLGPPDDAFLRQVLVKLFADRQLEIDPGVVDYLVARMERSYSAANTLVESLDRESLARGRRVTKSLCADLLVPDSDD